MMKKNRAFAIVSLFIVMAQFSCASAPPGWILNTPPPDAVNTWFVGMSTSRDSATAANDATANLIAGIMQYLGVKVTVNTSAKAKASLDSYSAEISQAVTTESNSRLAGFQVKQKYMTEDKKAHTVTVYILASYATAELNKEKQRMEAIFQEQIDAVAKPEAEGDALAGEGKIIDAIKKYIEAATAASGSGIDNADIKLVRNINKARGLLGSLAFAMLVGNQKTAVGQAFPTPFQVRLTASSSIGQSQSASFADGASGVSDAQLQVSYQVKQASGRLTSKTVSARTDTGGVLSFMPPAPDFVGKAKLTVRLDLQSSIELLNQIPQAFDSEKSALQEDMLSKYIEIPYQVYSLANSIPTGICLIDFDENGARLSGDVAQAALMEALGKEKFLISATPLDPGMVVSMSDQAILSSARNACLGTVTRIIYGTVKIISVRKDGSNYLAQAAGQVRALDLVSGRILYSADKSYTSVGMNEADARRSALRDLGLQVFGKDIPASLP
jgi:hypothetical protein